MTSEPIAEFLMRFEGGPLDGETRQSKFTMIEDLPDVLIVDSEGGPRYALVSASRLPPTKGIWRGAMYRHVLPAKSHRQHSTRQAAGGQHLTRLPEEVVAAIRRTAAEAEALERHLRLGA